MCWGLWLLADAPGLYFCFKRLTDATIFIIIYGLFSMYFAGVMVRLVLVATPALCLIGGIAVSASLKGLSVLARENPPADKPAVQTKQSGSAKAMAKSGADQALPMQKEVAWSLILATLFCLVNFATHSIWVTSESYSSPSIVLMARHGNTRVIFDDFREAYSWLRHNTPPDAKVLPKPGTLHPKP